MSATSDASSAAAATPSPSHIPTLQQMSATAVKLESPFSQLLVQKSRDKHDQLTTVVPTLYEEESDFRKCKVDITGDIALSIDMWRGFRTPPKLIAQFYRYNDNVLTIRADCPDIPQWWLEVDVPAIAWRSKSYIKTLESRGRHAVYVNTPPSYSEKNWIKYFDPNETFEINLNKRAAMAEPTHPPLLVASPREEIFIYLPSVLNGRITFGYQQIEDWLAQQKTSSDDMDAADESVDATMLEPVL